MHFVATYNVKLVVALIEPGRGVHARMNAVRLRACAAILIAAIHWGCGVGAERLTFQAKVSDLRKQSNALAKGKRPDETIELTLRGALPKTPASVNLIQRSAADFGTPESATTAILSASTAGDVSWIVDSFVRAERDETVKQLADPAVRERTRSYYSSLGKVELFGCAEVREFRVMFLRGMDADGDASLLTVTLSKTPSGWKQTNALSGDDTFDVIWTALHTGGVH